MSYEEAKALLYKYKDDTATDAEKAIVEKWLFQLNQEQPPELDDAALDAIGQQIYRNLPQPGRQPRPLWHRIAAAAAILLFLSAGLWVIFRKQPKVEQSANYYRNDIAPAINKTVLTLSNGQKIYINNAGNGQLARQGGTRISKSNGRIIYIPGNGKGAKPAYNTISTSKGGTAAVTLPDSTKAYLNALSSLRYLTAFNGADRHIELSGEGYFEVAHNSKPFKVTVAGQTVEDLGTHFNINAYGDEAVIKTTLLEGSVKISMAGQQVILKPGEQAQTTDRIKVVTVDASEEIAWKNGFFQFDNTSIQSVMRQIGRWYDVDIKYDYIPQVHYSGGGIPRLSNVSAVLDQLHQTGHTNFKVEGKTITIIK